MRNIGLKVKQSKEKIDPNDKKNPFNGTLSIRGKLFEGKVVSAKSRNTATIEREAPVYFTKFKRYARGKSSIHAHVPSNIEVQEGDRVVAAECRPLSKSVSFVIVEVKK